MQSTPAAARPGLSLRGGWACQNPATAPPGGGGGGTWGLAFPELGEPGKLWLPRALDHRDSPSGHLGARWPEPASPSWPLMAQTAGLCAGLQNGGATYSRLHGRPKRGLKTDSLHRGCGHPVRSLSPDLLGRSALPALCKLVPDTHNLQDSLGPKGRSHTRHPLTTPLPRRRDRPQLLTWTTS